jgi:hypothetical protein
MNARLILCSVPSTAQEGMAQFYATLLGDLVHSRAEQGRSSYGWACSGVRLTVNQPQHEMEKMMLHFRVDDLEDALRQLQEAGGLHVGGPYDVPVSPADLDALRSNYEQLALGSREEVEESLGRGAVVRDPEGNQIGLLQLRPFAERFFEAGSMTRHERLQHAMAMRDYGS